MQTEARYSTLDFEKALDLKRVTLQDWINRRYVTPSIPAEGRGTAARFSHEDGVMICLFQKLIQAGLEREAAAMVVGDVREMQRTGTRVGFVWVRSSLNPATGKIRRGIIALEPGENILDFRTGRTPAIEEEAKTPEAKGTPITDEQWFDCHLVNMAAVRQAVDAGLARL